LGTRIFLTNPEDEEITKSKPEKSKLFTAQGINGKRY
jgi:hypothetical protein